MQNCGGAAHKKGPVRAQLLRLKRKKVFTLQPDCFFSETKPGINCQESTACEQPLKEDKEETQETSVAPTTSANDISSVQLCHFHLDWMDAGSFSEPG